MSAAEVAGGKAQRHATSSSQPNVSALFCRVLILVTWCAIGYGTISPRSAAGASTDMPRVRRTPELRPCQGICGDRGEKGGSQGSALHRKTSQGWTRGCRCACTKRKASARSAVFCRAINVERNTPSQATAEALNSCPTWQLRRWRGPKLPSKSTGKKVLCSLIQVRL